MIYTMKLIEDEFNNIKFNNKILEIRINDKKRQHIKIDDKIEFYNILNMEEYILVNVEQVFTFKSFFEAYNSFPKSYFGYQNMSMEQILEKIYKIYTEEEEDMLGVMAIKFRIDNNTYKKYKGDKCGNECY